jgi:hypothetical protein
MDMRGAGNDLRCACCHVRSPSEKAADSRTFPGSDRKKFAALQQTL